MIVQTVLQIEFPVHEIRVEIPEPTEIDLDIPLPIDEERIRLLELSRNMVRLRNIKIKNQRIGFYKKFGTPFSSIPPISDVVFRADLR